MYVQCAFIKRSTHLLRNDSFYPIRHIVNYIFHLFQEGFIAKRKFNQFIDHLTLIKRNWHPKQSQIRRIHESLKGCDIVGLQELIIPCTTWRRPPSI